MKTKTIIAILILLSGCKNEFRTEELQRISEINESIASKYSCKLTVEVIEEKDKRLEILIEDNAQDELLTGKIFYDYISKVKNFNLEFDSYVFKEDNKAIYTISNVETDKLQDVIKDYQTIVNKIQTDKKTLYDLLDDNLKNSMSFEIFEAQMSELNLDSLKFCGFVFNDALMSLGFENSKNRLLLISNPMSNETKILGIQIQ